MIRRNDDLEIHTTKPMRPPPEYITCPLCRRNVQSQAIGGHLNFKHEIRGVSLDDLKTMTLRGTARKILSDLELEGKKKLLDEAVYAVESDSKKENKGDNPGPPGDPSCFENPGAKLKENPGNGNPGKESKFEQFLDRILPPWWF